MPHELRQARAADRRFEAWRRAIRSPTHKVPGYAIVTLSLKPVGGPPGDATAEQMDAIADLAERYSFGEIRVGHEQNLVLPHVAQRDLPALWARARRHRRRDAERQPGHRHHRLPGARLLRAGQCALDPDRAGIDAALRQSRYRHADRPAAHQHLRLHQCLRPSSCRPYRHSRRREERRGVLSDHASAAAPTRTPQIGALIGPAVPYAEVADVVEDIVEAYLALRARPDEMFVDTVKRLGVEPFKERVYATR